MFMLMSQAWAQTQAISGKVTDGSTGQGLPGVTVLAKGTSVGASTDVDGNYTITPPAGVTTLTFSFIGYGTLERTIGNATTVNVTLSVDANQLNEVVVVGYGTQTKREVAGAISQINGAQIENRPVASLDKAMQGRAAGVVVQANNGIPGGAINVQIRGIGSFSSNTQPLYIIDGVQVNTDSRAGFTQSNPLAQINTNDIESIEIIKDAATAAIYGAQGANGVVIITTKKGKAGRTNITANYYTGFSDQLKKFDVLNTQEFFALRTEARRNAGANAETAKSSQLSEMGLGTLTDEQIAALPSYDWQDEVFRRGTVSNYELSASGGNEKTTFFISGAYNTADAIITKADFKRGTLRTNFNHKASDKLSFELNMNLSSFQQSIPFAVSGTSLGSPAFAGSTILPHNRVYNEDGTYFGLPGSGQVFGGVLNQNVVAVNELNTGYQRTNGIIGAFAATYKILPFLSFRSAYNLDYNITQGKSYRDPRTNDAYTRRGLGQVQSDWNTNFQTTQLLNFNQVFVEDHKVDAQVGFEYRNDNNEGIYAAADGFPSPQFQNLNSAANPLSVGEFYTGYKRTGVFGTLSYVYKGKYSVRGVLRYDGSSRFGEDTKFGYFPGIAAAWNISDESFLQNAHWLSSLKLRASWGRNGRDGSANTTGNYPALGLYGGGGVYGGSPGIAPSGLANPALKWEVREMIDAGIDFAFFDNRISGTLGGFVETNKDLLLAQPLQGSTGYTGITTNVGSLEQRGVEVELNTVNVNFNGFNWRTYFNFTYIQNEVTKLYGDVTELPGSPGIRIGYDIGSIFTYEYAGVNPATGRPMWYDINNNVTYSPVAADRRIIGTTRPKYTGGFGNTLTYKGFDLDFLFQYQYGRLQSDGQFNFLAENGNRGINSLTEIYERRWTTPGQITDVPRAYNAGSEPQGINHITGSTRTFTKTDYIRLKNVQLGYTIPSSLMSKIKLNSARVYVQATNFFTYTDFQGYDPEFFNDPTGIIPQSKNMTFGVQIGL